MMGFPLIPNIASSYDIWIILKDSRQVTEHKYGKGKSQHIPNLPCHLRKITFLERTLFIYKRLPGPKIHDFQLYEGRFIKELQV